MFKIGTVCSGIGSPEVAISKHEHEIVFACDIDKYARASYLANFIPGAMFTDMTSEDFHANAGYSDLFIGGIPCQAFSLAGKRLGELDKRGLLFYDFYRYVDENRPKVFIIENVKGLLSDNKGKTFQNWLLLLGNSVNGHNQMFNHPDSLGYNLHHTVLNSKNFGVPQNRERVFIIGIRQDLPNDFRFPIGWKLNKRLKDVLETNVDEKYYLSDKMLQGFIEKGNKGFINQDTQASQVHDVENIMPTISAGTHGYANGYVKDITNLQGKEIINTIRTGGRGSLTDKHNWDMVIVKEATKQGYAIAEPGDSINLSNPNSETRRGRVGNQIANTLDTACNQAVVEPFCVAMRGRNPENPSDRTTGGATEQRLEPNSQVITNTITSVQKDNLIIEQVVQLNPSKESGGKQPYQQNRVYDSECLSPTIDTGAGRWAITEPQLIKFAQLAGVHDATARVYDNEGICPTITAKQGGGHEPKTNIGSRIRRLTPLECWRLQGFPDANFYKAKEVNSDTQLYKQAGNSMTTNVMEAIIDNLIHLL